VLAHCAFGPHDAVTVQVAGKAYHTGRCTFTVEDEDPLKDGFLLL
jgi:proline racemase